MSRPVLTVATLQEQDRRLGGEGQAAAGVAPAPGDVGAASLPRDAAGTDGMSSSGLSDSDDIVYHFRRMNIPDYKKWADKIIHQARWRNMDELAGADLPALADELEMPSGVKARLLEGMDCFKNGTLGVRFPMPREDLDATAPRQRPRVLTRANITRAILLVSAIAAVSYIAYKVYQKCQAYQQALEAAAKALEDLQAAKAAVEAKAAADAAAAAKVLEDFKAAKAAAEAKAAADVAAAKALEASQAAKAAAEAKAAADAAAAKASWPAGARAAAGGTALVGFGTAHVVTVVSVMAVDCLDGDAEITMADRTHKKIKDVEAGDKILSFNLGKAKVKTVLEVTTGTSNSMRSLRMHGPDGVSFEVKATEGHPFYTGEKKWAVVNPKQYSDTQPVKELKVGDMIISRQGVGFELTSISDRLPRSATFNLVVDGAGSFFVHGLLSHSGLPPPKKH